MKNLFIKWLKSEWRYISWKYKDDVNWECEHFCLFFWMLKYNELNEDSKLVQFKQWSFWWEHFCIFHDWEYIDLTMCQFWEEFPEEYISNNMPESFREIWRYSLKDYIEWQRAFLLYKNPNNLLNSENSNSENSNSIDDIYNNINNINLTIR